MSETIQLSKPILVDGSHTTTLTISKPTFKDFIAFSKPIAEKNPFSKSLEVIWRNPSEIEVVQRMLRKMANLNDVEIDMLDPEMAFEIAGELQGFLDFVTPSTQALQQ
jgi:hypothetical protein